MIDLEDCHVWHARNVQGRNGKPLLLLSSVILHPDFAECDAVAVCNGMMLRYLDNPITCDHAEDLANCEMILRARRRASGLDPQAMLRMTFSDPGLAGLGLVIVNVEAKPIRFREGGRA